jgi:flavin reductase (DIM6/NTAB) family NADH-FMN oxidoreductase RutF
MGVLPTGVTVVTAVGPDGPAGATANAVSSLSLEPMMMLAALDRGSRTLLAVQAANRFGINVLGAGQGDLARGFSAKGPVAEKWEGVGWSERDGIPILDGVIAWVSCELVDLIAGGDHVIVTGQVLGVEVPGGEPLIFHRGAYRGLDG